jgi:hypothetical protein
LPDPFILPKSSAIPAISPFLGFHDLAISV